MAWKFEEWRSWQGSGGHWVRLLIVSGAIGAGALVWWLRPDGDHYFTTRDAAEIKAAIIERTIARMQDTETSMYSTGEPYSLFASTNGAFWTNALPVYPMHDYFLAIEMDIASLYSFNSLPTPRSSYILGQRAWIDLSGAGGFIQAYDTAKPLWDVAGVRGGTNHPYAMQYDWYTANIHDYADNGSWLPWGVAAVPIYDATHHYVQTSTVHTIARALSACRWTVEYDRFNGATYFIADEYPLVRGRDYINLTWDYTATGGLDTAFSALLTDAIAGLAAAEPEKPIAYYDESVEEMVASLDYACIYYHYGYINMTESWRRTVTLRERVVGHNDFSTVTGTNYTAYSTGGIETYEDADYYFHDFYGADNEPTTLLTAKCRRWPIIDPPEFPTNSAVENVFALANGVVAWDGRFPEAVWRARAPDDADGDAIRFGWQSIDTNSAIVIDWQFQYLTNRAAFWSD